MTFWEWYAILNTMGVKDVVKNYGMVLVDECHHVPALMFEQVLKSVNAKYIEAGRYCKIRKVTIKNLKSKKEPSKR